MRLWSVHPRYLDAKGLVALWREALLAKAVLAGKTKGYTRHPQLERFRASSDPMVGIDSFLRAVCEEAQQRNYAFDESKIGLDSALRMPVTRGQLAFEWEHLRRKLTVRDRAWLAQLPRRIPEPHPLFVVVGGPVEKWERR